jgi:Modifier of rudimentary (Mod(r)) protein
MSLAGNLVSLEQQILHVRQNTQSRLLSLRALERQWRTKQAEQDEALKDFSAPALYQRLSAAVGEQEQLCRGLEESFLESEDASSGGKASEREVADFVRRLREAKRIAYLRRERRERWDEGRIGGWRG